MANLGLLVNALSLWINLYDRIINMSGKTLRYLDTKLMPKRAQRRSKHDREILLDHTLIGVPSIMVPVLEIRLSSQGLIQSHLY